MDPSLVAVGPYMSCEFGKHIQSFFVGLDRRSLLIMETTWRCPNLKEDRMSWIIDTEVVIFEETFY
jgi:hypothetical protein